MTVSLSTLKLKSGMGTPALKTGSALVKSSVCTRGSIRIWSITLTPGVIKPLSDFISVAFDASSGKSPTNVMLLPLRLIENRDNDRLGALGVFEGPLTGDVNVGSAPVGPLTPMGRSDAP